ncbi:MAG: histidine phosphatase family protein [bacterium]|nr:histidine phosphatase family protein [bacterium]
MTTHITYFVHGTTTDNEQGLCTGWDPGELSELGIQQANELGNRVDASRFGIMFCSDLKRAVDSARLGFDGKLDIIEDKRLRECDYGFLTRKPERMIDYTRYIRTPFPNGESLQDVEKRIRDFLRMLESNYTEKHIAIMAHKAPQLALEVVLNGKSWEQAIDQDWRKTKSWQPGWNYEITQPV